jgi:hypothetical protein
MTVDLIRIAGRPYLGYVCNGSGIFRQGTMLSAQGLTNGAERFTLKH